MHTYVYINVYIYTYAYICIYKCIHYLLKFLTVFINEKNIVLKLGKKFVVLISRYKNRPNYKHSKNGIQKSTPKKKIIVNGR